MSARRCGYATRRGSATIPPLSRANPKRTSNMAKARRVVRKVPPSGGRYFDEQLWPIYIALVVLGGFLMGVSAAYLPLAGVPWYRTAWPSLIAIPLVVAAAMVAFAMIDNRLVRRSLQL